MKSAPPKPAHKPDTLFDRQQNELDTSGGRFQKLTPTTVTGAANSSVPKQPETSPWHGDPTGTPRQSNINGLLLQTSVLARIEPKGVFGAVTNSIVSARRQAIPQRGFA